MTPPLPSPHILSVRVKFTELQLFAQSCQKADQAVIEAASGRKRRAKKAKPAMEQPYVWECRQPYHSLVSLHSFLPAFLPI